MGVDGSCRFDSMELSGTVKVIEGFKQHPPRGCLSAPRWTYKDYSVVEADQAAHLNHLSDPGIRSSKLPAFADHSQGSLQLSIRVLLFYLSIHACGQCWFLSGCRR
mmetsp:Transcript_25955/g.68381  ORF Transcript_25955/g.68381 Transcript_25955/m.68381 type:complete len:106 (-) Transcript_25955:212-529(-)